MLGRRVLERVGIPVYENDVVRLTKDGRPFWLAGLGDQMAFISGRRKRARRRFEGVDDLPGTLAKVTDDAPVILLAHEPDIFPRVPDRVALTLSGHTHGGQVRMFGYSPMVPSRFGNRYAYGHIVEDDRNLDRLGRARLLDPAGAHRRAAGDRDGRCRSRLIRLHDPCRAGPTSPAASSWMRDGRAARAARPRLLRGHRFLRPRLSRQLHALVRARPLRFPAPDRQRSSRA